MTVIEVETRVAIILFIPVLSLNFYFLSFLEQLKDLLKDGALPDDEPPEGLEPVICSMGGTSTNHCATRSLCRALVVQ